MKTLILASLSVSAVFVALLLFGCSSTAPRSPEQRVQSAARFGAFTAATVLLADDPQTRAPLSRAESGLSELIAAKRWDIAEASAILSGCQIGKLDATDGRLILGGVLMFVDVAGLEVDLRETEAARGFILGADAGLSLALRGGAK